MIGNCVASLKGVDQEPIDYMLGTGLVGPQAELEVKNKKIMRGAFSMFNYVDVIHDALDCVCEEEKKSQRVLSLSAWKNVRS